MLPSIRETLHHERSPLAHIEKHDSLQAGRQLASQPAIKLLARLPAAVAASDWIFHGPAIRERERSLFDQTTKREDFDSLASLLVLTCACLKDSPSSSFLCDNTQYLLPALFIGPVSFVALKITRDIANQPDCVVCSCRKLTSLQRIGWSVNRAREREDVQLSS